MFELPKGGSVRQDVLAGAILIESVCVGIVSVNEHSFHIKPLEQLVSDSALEGMAVIVIDEIERHLEKGKHLLAFESKTAAVVISQVISGEFTSHPHAVDKVLSKLNEGVANEGVAHA